MRDGSSLRTEPSMRGVVRAPVLRRAYPSSTLNWKQRCGRIREDRALARRPKCFLRNAGGEEFLFRIAGEIVTEIPQPKRSSPKMRPFEPHRRALWEGGAICEGHQQKNRPPHRIATSLQSLGWSVLPQQRFVRFVSIIHATSSAMGNTIAAARSRLAIHRGSVKTWGEISTSCPRPRANQ